MFRSVCLLIGSAIAIAAAPKGTSNIDKGGLGLKGYDAVSYRQPNGPFKGEGKYSVEHQGVKYVFVSEANKNEFESNPNKFLPQFGGWCAYAVADSKSKVDVDPRSFVIQDDRLLLFYNGVWGNTRSKWMKDQANFLKRADANWPETERKDP